MAVKALLLLDNTQFHRSEDEFKNVKIENIFLPSNVKSLVQPIHQGIIEN